jgi:hypothetical protein
MDAGGEENEDTRFEMEEHERGSRRKGGTDG